MKEKIELIFYLILILIKICRPGGVKAVISENIAMRQQLITLNRGRRRAPKLTTFDRFFFGFMAQLRSHAKLNSHSHIPTSAHLCPIFDYKDIEIVHYYFSLWNQKSNKCYPNL